MLVLAIIITLILLASCWVPREPDKMLFWGAVVGAVASYVGGRKKAKDQKKANAANSPAGQVAQWEDAEINPAFGISSGGYIPQQASTIGDSFAQAGAIFGEGLERDHAQKLEQTETKKENRELRKQLDKLSRPKTAGHLETNKLPLPGEKATTLKPGEFKKDGEADRLDIDAGGSPSEASIYEMDLPIVGTISTSRPMFGERSEGYAGDIGQIPLVGAQMITDLAQNARGMRFNPQTQEWEKKPTVLNGLMGEEWYEEEYERNKKRRAEKIKQNDKDLKEHLGFKDGWLSLPDLNLD